MSNSDKIEGYLEVGQNSEQTEVVLNLPRDMTGHINFSPNQARGLASLLVKHANDVDNEERKRDEKELHRKMQAESPPVDRTSVTLTDGSAVSEDHRQIQSNGQQKGYVVLSEEERRRGFVRPVRRTYTHEKCGVATTMGQSIAETYARDPSFYGGTFCCGCSRHFPLFIDGIPQFRWDDGSAVGS